MYDTEVPQTSSPFTEQAKEYKPPRSQALRDYNIGIEFMSIGCVISVGCQRIPFTSVDEAMKELNAYVKDPVAAQKIWKKRFEDYDKQ